MRRLWGDAAGCVPWGLKWSEDTMRLKAILLMSAAMMLGGVCLLGGCEKKEPATLGEALDQATQETGQAMQEMGEKVEDAAK